MAPKRTNARDPPPSITSTTQSSTTASSSTPPATKSSPKSKDNQTAQEIALGVWNNYLDTTPQRTKLIDVFMAFLVVVGGLQFLYCVIAGNYVRWVSTWVGHMLMGIHSRSMHFCRASPLLWDNLCWLVGGFGISREGTCWLRDIVASLRIQTNVENKAEFLELSPERYVLRTGSVGLDWFWFGRAFADYVFGSLILHFFCVNFIN